jgi:hypothetical protein
MSLQPHPTIPPLDDGKPVLVVINDGWGVNTEDEFNAVFSAETPNYDALAAVPGRFRTVQVRARVRLRDFETDCAGPTHAWSSAAVGGRSGAGGRAGAPLQARAASILALPSRTLTLHSTPARRRTAALSACRPTMIWAIPRSATMRWVSCDARPSLHAQRP